MQNSFTCVKLSQAILDLSSYENFIDDLIEIVGQLSSQLDRGASCAHSNFSVGFRWQTASRHAVVAYPTDPSICSSISRFISTAYSIGSSFTSGSMKPVTIIEAASASVRPRLIR